MMAIHIIMLNMIQVCVRENATYSCLEVKKGKIVAVYGYSIENYSGIVTINENAEMAGKVMDMIHYIIIVTEQLT